MIADGSYYYRDHWRKRRLYLALRLDCVSSVARLVFALLSVAHSVLLGIGYWVLAFAIDYSTIYTYYRVSIQLLLVLYAFLNGCILK